MFPSNLLIRDIIVKWHEKAMDNSRTCTHGKIRKLLTKVSLPLKMTCTHGKIKVIISKISLTLKNNSFIDDAIIN